MLAQRRVKGRGGADGGQAAATGLIIGIGSIAAGGSGWG